MAVPLVGNRPKILVVDDEPDVRNLVCRLLGPIGEVATAVDGADALDRILGGDRPDLIVLDLMMPEVSGFDVVLALNENPETARIPILVVTAKHLTPEDRERLNGFVMSIMEKANFDRDRFIAEVRRALAGRHAVAG